MIATYLLHAIGNLRGVILEEHEVDALLWSMLPDEDKPVVEEVLPPVAA